MTNETRRKVLKALANAPAIAAADLLIKLPPEERTEAQKLFAALGVKLPDQTKSE